MHSLKLAADASGKIAIGMVATDHIDNIVLAAGVAKTYTIPTGAAYLLMSGTALFFARFGGAASIPIADVTDGTGACVAPEFREVPDDITTVSFISSVNCIVAIEVFA